MRVQKSVYRMTDRELRLYKRQLRRKQQIRRRVFTMTQVTVAYGETLWDLSENYIDYEEYKDKNEYIEEVQSINHLAEEDSIRAGQTLIVPYYSYDFVK